ncbi:MAG: hypothetical protein KDK39_04350 [Leptospiraceae bacterium]|nr:hypothetical protein [Leptospiraceae bacterium]
MAQYQAFTEGVEVNGETVLSVVEGLGAFKGRALTFLADNGIENPVPGQWYSQQAWLNAFKAIAESTGEFTLYNIGRKIPENAQFPPEIDSIEKALQAIDVAYHMNHRLHQQVMFDPTNGRMIEGIGHYYYEPQKERKVIMRCENPYPSEFDRGIIEAMANRFKPAGSFVMVHLDRSQPMRKSGGESCSFVVSW